MKSDIIWYILDNFREECEEQKHFGEIANLMKKNDTNTKTKIILLVVLLVD